MQQVKDVQKGNKALTAEIERLQRVKNARILQLEQARLVDILPTCIPHLLDFWQAMATPSPSL